MTNQFVLHNFKEHFLNKEKACHTDDFLLKYMNTLIGFTVARGSPLKELMNHM